MEEKRSLNELAQDFQEMTKKASDSFPVSNTTTIQGEKIEFTNTNVISMNDTTTEYVAIEKKNVEKIRDLCKQNMNDNRSWISEVSLVACSLFAGWFISAIMTGIAFLPDWKGVLFYVVSPVVAVACIVIYFSTRKIESLTKKNLADQIIDCLPEEKDESE